MLKDHPKFLHTSKTKKLVRPSDGKKQQKEALKRKALDESSRFENASRLIKAKEDRNMLMARCFKQREERVADNNMDKRAAYRENRVSTLERIMALASSSVNPQIRVDADEVRDLELASLLAEIKADANRVDEVVVVDNDDTVSIDEEESPESSSSTSASPSPPSPLRVLAPSSQQVIYS